MRQGLLITALTGALVCPVGVVAATDQDPTQQKAQQQIDATTKKTAYGSELLTSEENSQYRAKLRAANTAEERDKVRNEYQALMQERAKERGVTLIDRPARKGREGFTRAGRDAKGNKSMTVQEKAEYRSRLQTAKTPEERDMIQKEYRELMQERSTKQGATPPQQPSQPGTAP
jgi:hypothetical protein